MQAANKTWTLLDKEAYDEFVNPGEVVEIRLIGVHGKAAHWGQKYAKGTVSGYFDNFIKFQTAVKTLECAPCKNVYFTLQVINPDLGGRAYNRLLPADQTTSDRDVLYYRWLPVDIDPVRPSGISSSDEELGYALELRERVDDFAQKELGLPAPIKAISGNGGHLLYRLPDLPAQKKENQAFISGALKMLSEKFSTDRATVDTAVSNPARIWKLYGTMAKKGDPVPAGPNRVARPHRMSYIESLGGS